MSGIRCKSHFSFPITNLVVRSPMLSKHKQSYLNKYFLIAEVMSDFSVLLFRYNEYRWMYASLNVKVVPVGHFKSL